MLQLASIFQNGMVLQRDTTVRIYGVADVGLEIKAQIQGKSASALCGSDGTWCIEFDSLEASKEETLTVSGGDFSIELNDVAIGDIYLAAGQSNMEFYMRYEKNYRSNPEITENKQIRFYDVPEVAFEKQKTSFDYSQMGIWRSATKENIEYFSAVAYYTAVELAKAQDIPIGIVGCNWGGTSSSSWMSSETAKKAAAPWVEAFEKKKSALNWDTYYDEEAASPMNNRGCPFEDAFSEMMLPRTPSAEEIAAFFADIPEGAVDLTRLKPQEVPGSLFENMVKEIAPFTVRAVLFYQGESDDELGYAQDSYDIRLKALMQDWRSIWNLPELPFFIVQLPGFREWMGLSAGDWTAIRSAQERVSEEDANVWLCSIADAGEEYDIHPKNKRIVGHRLALLVRKHIYGENIAADAPKLASAHRNGGEVRLVFANVGEGLKVDGDDLAGWEVSGAYTYRIEKDTVILDVTSSEEEIEVSVGQADWYQLNLKNSADVPVIPFHTSV